MLLLVVLAQAHCLLQTLQSTSSSPALCMGLGSGGMGVGIAAVAVPDRECAACNPLCMIDLPCYLLGCHMVMVFMRECVERQDLVLMTGNVL
jgi:hypothetical protein